MRIRWFGQSAFLLSGEQVVAIDPFGDMSGLAARGIEWPYPPIGPLEADLLLVTHEHGDHNAVEVVAGEPHTLRSRAGTFADTPVGEVVAVAGEHDRVAGTQRGPMAMYRFTLDGLRVCHLGDFGQAALRPEQKEALGEVDVLLLPVGGGPTVGGEEAAQVVRELAPRLVVPHHYRSGELTFLEPPDAFLDALGAEVVRLAESEAEVEPLLGTREQPRVALFAAPVR
ncbi:MAG TPA: MBL fold metallo-hydrolase [Gaiellaceae bacterium]|nr:MBL fold metallo-hydrolase [Gaiellaceae bacterium]